MANPVSSKTRKPAPQKTPTYQPNWLLAGGCIILGLFMIVALFDYAPSQVKGNIVAGETLPSGAIHELPRETPNLVGRIGAHSAYFFFHYLGGTAWLGALFLFWLGYIYTQGLRRMATARGVGMLIALFSGAGLLSMQSFFYQSPDIYTSGGGGVLGHLLYEDFLKELLGVFGASILLLLTFAFSTLFVLTRDIGAQIEKAVALFTSWQDRLSARSQERAEQKRLEAEVKKRQREEAVAELKKQASTPIPSLAASKQAKVPIGLGNPKNEKRLSLRRNEAAPAAAEEPTDLFSKLKAAAEGTLPVAATPAETPVAAKPTSEQKISLKIVTPEPLKKAAQQKSETSDNYIFPPMELLREPAARDTATSEEEHRTNAETLLRTLAEFGVDVTLGEVHTGPVITRYEIMPAPGVRVEKISGLDKNIALGMRAQSVRILAPVPGKGVVGVEVPNQKSIPVGLREILESAEWVDAKAELPIALGKDVSGAPIVADLTRMPHLLIAGSTGSGKSVCINSIIASLVYHAGPSKVRLLMVDPKIVELQVFNTVPHMLIPVVTEPKKVPGALKWLLAEMNKRYQIFAKAGVRNIMSFNKRKPGETKPEEPVSQQELPIEGAIDDAIEIPKHLPYIVCIIDELADLMMIAPAEVETSIARLAQLARAAGIHLIVATQRPSVDVVTGIIKANLPSRIAFQVASKVDSRTILDTGGADQLIGRGDLLFMPPGTSRLLRAQGAFVSDDEVHAIVEHLKKNGPPIYQQEVQEHVDRDPDAEESDGSGASIEGESEDDLFAQAIDVIRSTRRASTSMLQRRLRIGYNRAARLMELMEQKGIVGPENGAQPREILGKIDEL